MAGPFMAKGRLTFLRVHERGMGYGPSDDFLDAEAIVKLDSAPKESFGLKLRDDTHLPAREGMLELLQLAYRKNLTVGVEYMIDAGKHNGTIVRTYLSK